MLLSQEGSLPHFEHPVTLSGFKRLNHFLVHLEDDKVSYILQFGSHDVQQVASLELLHKCLRILSLLNNFNALLHHLIDAGTKVLEPTVFNDGLHALSELVIIAL